MYLDGSVDGAYGDAEAKDRRWRCYNALCDAPAMYRCYYFHFCRHTGCSKHVKMRVIDSREVYLCGRCRLMHLLGYPEEAELFFQEQDE